MKKNIIYVFAIIIVFSSSGCKNENPTITLAPETIEAPQFSAATKTSLEVYRNGKTYEIIIGYDMGRAPFYSAPVSAPPATWSESIIDGAEIEAYADFDNDGEMEIIVSKFSCGTYCPNWLLAYKYDFVNDKYFLADELYADLKIPNDLNNDGKPEFPLYNGFCFRWCTHGTQSLSALTILGYDGNKFLDITTDFPELIQEDAARLLELSQANEKDVAYITLPGYLFNMYRLGKLAEGIKDFNKVCNEVIKSYDCENFRLDVEKSIMEYKFIQ
jgi:hypothetical protein